MLDNGAAQRVFGIEVANDEAAAMGVEADREGAALRCFLWGVDSVGDAVNVAVLSAHRVGWGWVEGC